MNGRILTVMIMVKMNVQNLLNQKGKTRYWLVKEMQTTYKTVNKICDNSLTGLQLETIEKLCVILECEPNDLFIME
ncbi:MAG: helix-turn-helix domain-containing protein [Acutalibacteraceae bacterium]|jgi:DNA-binding Xre family transcriptional regulator